METIDYDKLIQDALRDVVRRTLVLVKQNGLPGNHHFYVTFRTNRNDVQMPEHLRREHPNEVTIVMQHQFWDLEVADEHFAVTLSFNGNKERLKVPYNALVSFMDPSVKFGLQFSPETTGDKALPPSPEDNGGGGDGGSSDKDNIVTLDAFRKKK